MMNCFHCFSFGSARLLRASILLLCALGGVSVVAQPSSQLAQPRGEPERNPPSSGACEAGWSALAIENPSFEELGTGRFPAKGWTLGQHVGVFAYKMSVDSTDAASGSRSFRIERFAEQAFGSVSQFVSIPPGTSKLRVWADLRTSVADGDGWVLFVNTNSRLGIVDQFRSVALTESTKWQRVVLDVPVTKEVTDIKLGAMLLGGGTGWVDSVSACRQ
jgi:hypothetical protein